MRAFFSLLLIPAALFPVGAVSAEPLAVNGTAGYLSEWQLSGKVMETASGDEFIGPLTIRHVGLCSHDGPEEKVTELKLRVTGFRPWSQFQATLVMDGTTCTFSGRFTATYAGFMDCAGAKGVPVTLSLE